MIPTPLRGQVYRADLGYGPKPWLIVSNNRRNRNLKSVLAVRITTSDKSGVATAVCLTSADRPLVGYIVADDLVQLYEDQIAGAAYVGSISPGTVPEVNKALAIALGLP